MRGRRGGVRGEVGFEDSVKRRGEGGWKGVLNWRRVCER